MAIDTVQKRMSIMKVKKPFMPQGIVPSGSIDRYAAMWIYSGIELADPTVIVYVRAPVTLTFEALSTKVLTYAAASTRTLTYQALTTKVLTYNA